MLLLFKNQPNIFAALYCLIVPTVLLLASTDAFAPNYGGVPVPVIQKIHHARGREMCDTTTRTTTTTTAWSTNARFQSNSVSVRRNMVGGDNGSNGDDMDYSRKLRLREEAESPFRKVRFFLYISVSGGAFVGLAISLARIGAALSGINEDLLQESLLNLGVDLAGLALVGFLYRRDQNAEESRLKRAARGAGLAQLSIRASKSVLEGDLSPEGSTFTTNLASLRRGRGIDKRVVIAAAGKEKIAQVLLQAKELEDDMDYNDLLVVPVVMPQGVAPMGGETGNDGVATPNKSVALPVVVGNNWKSIVDEEAAEAVKQGVNIEDEGFCIVLKKNGRVGQRTRGIFLENLLGNVVARREAGMDVTNI